MHNQSNPDLQLAAVLFLLTQYVLQGRRHDIARAVIEHLERLTVHRDRLPPILSRAIPHLSQQWRAIADEQPPTHWPLNQPRAAADNTSDIGANIIRFPTRRVDHGQ